MTIEEARDILRQFNHWRRDDHIPNAYEKPHPFALGAAIDLAIDVLAVLIDSKEDKSDLEGLAKREAQQ